VVISGAGTVTLSDADTFTLNDGGTIVVAGNGAVNLPNSSFGVGTFTAEGDVVITAGAENAGDTIVTGNTAEDGLIFGEDGTTAFSLLTHAADDAAATYTVQSVTFGNRGSAIVIDEGGSLDASATAKIVLLDGTISLGAGATLVLANDATIGKFTGDGADVASIDPATDDVSAGTVGGAAISGSKLVNGQSDDEGIFTAEQVGGTSTEATLTTGEEGGSVISVNAPLVEGEEEQI
jgi:hypothetical protein